MNLLELATRLDREFRIPAHTENLVEWAVTDANQGFVRQDFLGRKTALMIAASAEIEKVYTCVFVTDTVVRKLTRERNGLLFTHHHFNYYEDSRGLQAMTPETIRTMLDSNNSLYVAHGVLDTHPEYGTSLALARHTDVTVDQAFYDYHGARRHSLAMFPGPLRRCSQPSSRNGWNGRPWMSSSAGRMSNGLRWWRAEAICRTCCNRPMISAATHC